MTSRDAKSNDVAMDLPTIFQIWGARGSRNATGSTIANRTSCYSLAVGQDLYVFDAGSGLLELSAAQPIDARLAHIRRVHLLVTHAHWDHWEGLKDAEWLWRKGNGIELTILGPREALDAIDSTCRPPSFVKLEILALGTLKSLSFVELEAGKEIPLPSAQLLPLPLNHYSGMAPNEQHLCTLGYRLSIVDGPTVVYLCDHEPTAATSSMEDAALASANLAIVDASYGSISEHAFGHGSIESAAVLSRRFPQMRILASHHGPMRADQDLHEALKQHGSGLPRLSLASEGHEETWDAENRCFVGSAS